MELQKLTKEEAEKISGIKLDGRRKYFLWNSEVCINGTFTNACTGCSPDDEYTSVSCGSGCQECGYTGKRRDCYPMPVQYLTKKPKATK